MSSAARTGSGASRPASASGTSVGILTPARPASLNQTAATADAVSPASRKRKRDVSTRAQVLQTDQLLKAPVVLKPHPAKLTAKPHILHPLMLLPRDNLPLSALDLSQPYGDFPASRFFESQIKILDLEGRLGSNVLLARSETSRAVYAIEREGNGLYVLCRLGAWADIESLSQVATVVCSQRMRSTKPVKADISTATPLITPHMHKENKKRRLAIEEIQSMVRRRSVVDKESRSRPSTPITNPLASEGTVSQKTEPALGQAAESALVLGRDETPVLSAMGVNESLAQPTADDIFQNIRVQYFEALYHSMGSLAYFAKGPLSRARAAFHLDCDFNLEMTDLIDFLRSLVMTTILIDKKYRETIPDIVGKMSALDGESDHVDPKTRKRKAKKPKMGKDGLYPSEDEHVRRWWAANKPAAVGNDEKTITSTETKYHISCLRRRETQLQMILILEILALEPLGRVAVTGEESQLPGMDSQLRSEDASQEPAARKKSRTNLPVLLDVHADRLCIWQTTMSDETKALAESQVLPDGQHVQRPERGSSDPLRDFCVDIVVPFFSARLPELCDSINRKLGGPVVQSPPKEKNPKSAIQSKSKPGAPAKRPTALRKDKEKILERVLSNERMRRSISRGPSGALALMRSASSTAIPGLKREGSEPLMAMIPRGETVSLKEKPTNVFSWNTNSAGEDSRAKKKAQVEAELKDAISALKKPNRALAVKELVEAAERRATTGVSQLKKLKKPSRISSVQVKATPANNRFKDVLAAGAGSAQLDHTLLDSVPSSSSMIPSSTAPRKFANMLGRSLASSAARADSIQATPARTPAVAAQPPRESAGKLPSSPIMARKAAPAASTHVLSVPPGRFSGRSQGMDLPSSPGLVALFETPSTRGLIGSPPLMTPRSSRGFRPGTGPPDKWRTV